jgi:RHS repeat-associated protein
VTTSGSSNANTFGFTGRENDGTGFSFYRARYYYPLVHRFVSQDPLGFKDGTNDSLYAANDPVSNVDPLGLEIILLGRVPLIPRGLPPNMRFNPARPLPRPTPPQIPRSIPVDPRIPPVRPVTDPFIELMGNILDHLTGVGGATRPPAGRKDPDCRMVSGVAVCKA